MKENAWKKVAANIFEVEDEDVNLFMLEQVKTTFKSLRDRFMKLRRQDCRT